MSVIHLNELSHFGTSNIAAALMSKKILIVEDDVQFVELIKINLEDLDCELVHAATGDDGLHRALNEHYALVILDVTLPRMSGFDICKKLRTAKPTQPILMLTSKAEEIDRVLGLELGADDYVVKPFSVRELVARIKGLLRREELGTKPAKCAGARNFGDLHIDFERRRILLNSQPVELTAMEFDLLSFLASNPGVPYTREQLAAEVWGWHASGYDNTLNTHVSRLRAKIEPNPSEPLYLKTARGVGYFFAEPDEE